MLDTIRTAWGWRGFDPEEILATNAFGNVVVRATDGTYWRICPEEWSCECLARTTKEYKALARSSEFQADWDMTALVEMAIQKFGDLPPERCYCLKQPAILGGHYDSANLGTITREELLRFSGDMAQQIKDLPDGAKIEIKLVP